MRGCSGLNRVPSPDSSVEALTPRTSGWGLTLIQGRCKCSSLRSYWSRMGPESKMTSVLIKRGLVDTDKHTGRTRCEDEARAQWCFSRPRDAKDAKEPPQAREGPGPHSPPALRGNQACPTPGSQTCSLQNWQKVGSCCLSHPSRSTLLWQPKQTHKF